MYFKLRSYKPTDNGQVILLDKLTLKEIKAPGLPNHFEDLADIEANYLRSGSFVIAEADGEIIGMGAIRFSKSKSARINRMRVHPDHQRKGVARSILNWLERRAEENGIHKIELDALKTQQKAQALYESNGYRKLGEGSPNGFHIVMYEKEIIAGDERTD